MDLKTLYEANFTIFIGIFVTLAVMGTTTLYDRYRSKKSRGETSFNFEGSKFFSDLNRKAVSFRSECLKHFSEHCKKLSTLIQKKSGQGRKMSGSGRKMSGSGRKGSCLIRSSFSKNNLGKVERKLLELKTTIQKLSGNLRKKVSSLSSGLFQKNKYENGKSVSLLDKKETAPKLSAIDKVNNLDKVLESKKDELDFDDDLLARMSTSNTLKSKSPEPNIAGSFFDEISPEIDVSLDDDLILNGNELEIKIEGLDNEPVEDNFSFNDNSAEIKFGEESDSLLASLKKDIVISKEKRINFMDNMQGENLDLKSMKSDFEDVLGRLQKYRQYSKS